ncbi:MAG: YebC/PmpR family DNA-binding transcriptional regulator [Bacilli bacterium]|nr:YebC/PmpR family DNA-binding transcriptional regulator [Bacilli bacterium]
MGRHFEVRAAAMAASAKAKSAVYMRASKEIYAAAKSGIPDPESNLALRSAIEKYRKTCPKDVIERAIEKAKGGDATAYIEGRYEFFGPGNCYIIVDTLTDNVNRALVGVRTAVTKKGGKQGAVSFNFERLAVVVVKGDEALRDSIEEALILGDVDVREVTYEEGYVEIHADPADFEKAKDVLKEMGIDDFETAEITFVPNDYVTLGEEDLQKFHNILEALDEVEDVQNVYHNVENA